MRQGNQVVTQLVPLFEAMNTQAASPTSLGNISTADLRKVFERGEFATGELE